MAEEINPWKARFERERKAKKASEELLEQKSYELWEINQNLEKEVKKRTDSLNDALIKAKNADNAKTTFLANMSHEIRTPLNSIIGFSQVLSQSSDLTSKNNKYASIIESSAKSLLGIINDILDISKIESGNFEISLKETNIDEIGEHVFELFNNRALDKKIELDFSIDENIPSCVLSDGIRIRQVLSNFISNAIKFTPELGKIDFKISLIEEKEKNAKIRFLVKDSGIGIPEDKVDNIFQPFIQVDNESNRQYEGTGLGLSICSHIIESLDSKVHVESSIGNGSTFWFDLELEVCSSTRGKKKKKSTSATSSFNANILVAEDNPANQELIKYILESLGVTFTIASNGKEAVDLFIEKNNFDLILMDINMPLLDGISAFKQITAYEKENNLKHTPVSALTANAIKGDKEKFLELGMDYYLSKPIDINNLKEFFSIFLENKEEDTENTKEEIKQDNIEKVSAASVAKNLGLPEAIGEKLLNKFKADIIKDLDELQAFIEEENHKEIKQKAHYIKNSCLNIGLSLAVNILQELESNSSSQKKTLLNNFNKLKNNINFSISK